MHNHQKKWVYLIVLSIVWGSSFILMKKALLGITPLQLGALRILCTAIFMLMVGFSSLKKIQKKHWKYLVYTALASTLFPGFLFAFAIQHIDSAIASILNSLTPFNALLLGFWFFGYAFKKQQIIGILVGLVGTLVLILKGASINPNQNYWYAILVVIASLGYALNANIVKKHLSDLSALAITTGNFLLLILPTLIILFFTDFFTTFKGTEVQLNSLVWIAVLSLFGTGMAKVMYNKMVQISSPIFATSVAYIIPIVAVFWGVLDGEKLSYIQILAGLLILLGVYLVNRSK